MRTIQSSCSNRGRAQNAMNPSSAPSCSATMTWASGVAKRSSRATMSLGPAG